MNELPPGWARVPVGEVVSEAQPGFPSGRHNSAGVGVPHLRPMNVSRDGAVDVSTLKFVERPDRQRIHGGDVLFNNTNSPELVGKTAYFTLEGEWAYSNHMTRLRPSAAVDGRFLAAQLHWLWMTGAYGRVMNNHVNQASVATKTLLSQVHVVVPPLPEQRRIMAAIEEQLSRLDATDAGLRRLASRLALLERAVVERAFSADWPRQPLGAVAEIVGGVTKNKAGEADPSFVAVPYLRVANVQRGYLDLSSVTTIRVRPETATKLALRPGDVLFNEGGDRDKLGRGWVWSGEVDGCIHQNHVFRARLSGSFEPRFVSWWGNSFGRDWFWEHGRQTTNLASISLSTLKAFPVPAPSLVEQRQAVEEIDRNLVAAAHMRKEIDRARLRSSTLRRSILATAFRGELVPQEPDDEPASVLLERIAVERAAAPKQTRKRREKAPA